MRLEGIPLPVVAIDSVGNTVVEASVNWSTMAPRARPSCLCHCAFAASYASGSRSDPAQLLKSSLPQMLRRIFSVGQHH